MIATDTNIYVYRFDQNEPVKQAIAKNLIARLAREGQSRLLWQVAGELLNQLTYWHHKKLLLRNKSSECLSKLANYSRLYYLRNKPLTMRFN